LNSGNAVFTSTSRSTNKLASAIAKVVEERFGVVTRVIVKSVGEFEAIVTSNPFAPPESEHSRFIAAFALDNTKLQDLNALNRTGFRGGLLA
jgi:uncharacterized protein (DUF1697 family)